MTATDDRRSRAFALVGAFIVCAVAACDGDAEPTGPTAAPRRVAAVEVSPTSTTLHAIGAEQDFEVVARDKAGSPVPGVRVQ